MLLAEVEAIDAFDDVIESLKTAAVTAHQHILKTLSSITDLVHKEFEKPLNYEVKARVIRCISNIRGFPRTDSQLPSYIQLIEKARNMVSNDVVALERLMKESVDSKKIEDAMNTFQRAKSLDPCTNNEATKRLQSLESLCEKQTEVRDKIIEDIINRKDFVEIEKYLMPLSLSHNVAKRNKVNLYSRQMADTLSSQIRTCEGKLQSHFLKQDVKFVVDTLKTLTTANLEIGSIIYTEAKLKLPNEISNLNNMINVKVNFLLSKFSKGEEDNDFYTMRVSHYLATIIYELADRSLTWDTKSSYSSASSKWKSAQKSVAGKINSFFV